MYHNHPISVDTTTYAKHCKEGPDVTDKIYAILASGAKDPVNTVMVVSIHFLKVFSEDYLMKCYRPWLR